jgi:hypothetical protein
MREGQHRYRGRFQQLPVVKKEGICHASKKVDASDYCSFNVELWEPRGCIGLRESHVARYSSLVSLQ